jgi:hypothetical protein
MCPESQVGDFVRKIFRSLRIKLIRNLSIALLLAIYGTANLFPGKHPTPLAADIDAAKCLECHENKTKEKSIHTAVKGGCFSCHQVRVVRDVTRVNLTTTTVLSLCLKCHAAL